MAKTAMSVRDVMVMPTPALLIVMPISSGSGGRSFFPGCVVMSKVPVRLLMGPTLTPSLARTLLIALDVVERLHDDEHVVDAEADEEAGDDGVHRPIVQTHRRAQAEGDESGQAAARDTHEAEEGLESMKLS